MHRILLKAREKKDVFIVAGNKQTSKQAVRLHNYIPELANGAHRSCKQIMVEFLGCESKEKGK